MPGFWDTMCYEGAHQIPTGCRHTPTFIVSLNHLPEVDHSCSKMEKSGCRGLRTVGCNSSATANKLCDSPNSLGPGSLIYTIILISTWPFFELVHLMMCSTHIFSLGRDTFLNLYPNIKIIHISLYPNNFIATCFVSLGFQNLVSH